MVSNQHDRPRALLILNGIFDDAVEDFELR
jgi:hypothetical protein